MTKLGPYELGPGGECEGIYTGDARILSEQIPDESVDLIFTALLAIPPELFVIGSMA